MKTNKILALINVLICIAITLLNQRQGSIWVLCLLYIVACFFALIFINKRLILNNNFVVKISILYFIFFYAIVLNNSYNNWLEYLSLAFAPIVIFQTNFYLIQKRYLSINSLIFITVIILIVACYKVYTVSIRLEYLVGGNLQTNWSNLIGACLPIVFLIKKRQLQYLFLFAAGTFIIIGLKRTGMISLLITIFVMIFFLVKEDKVKFSITRALFILLLFALGYVYVFGNVEFNRIDTAMVRLEHLSKDGGSGRDDIFSLGVSNWLDNTKIPVASKIRGSGFFGFKRKSGLMGIESAHNDLIDFSYNYGIFAVVFLIFYYVRVLKLLFLSWKKRSKYFQFTLTTVIIFFIYSLFSAFYHYFVFFIPLILNLALMEVIHLNSSKTYIYHFNDNKFSYLIRPNKNHE
jgi:hypothetical protein